MQDKEYICVGFIRRPQGIRGEVRATVLLDNPKDISRISAVKVENELFLRKIERVFAVSDGFGIKLEGINTVNDVNIIKGKNLYAERTEIDKLKKSTDIYINDILNKTAKLDNGEVLGIISDVQNFGANDIVYITSEKYKNLCFANIGGIITDINKDGFVVLNKEEFDKVCVFD